jgi:hypothetical protein
MRPVISSTTFASNISQSKNNSARYCHSAPYFFMFPFFLSDLMKLEMSGQIFEKY